MRNFLREHWLYIVTPLVVVLAVLIVVVVTADGSLSDFIYTIY